jgi:hypothetical protein
MKELMTSWPVCSSRSYNVYRQERAIDPGFHQALLKILPRLQAVANRHAALAEISPARIEIYEAGWPNNEQRANGYANGTIGFPSSSIVFEDFPYAAMFTVHEATHHIQFVLEEDYLANRLPSEGWMYRQGALFFASRGGINPCWYDPQHFEGMKEPYEAAREAYAARPAERDALMRGDFVESVLRNRAFIS